MLEFSSDEIIFPLTERHQHILFILLKRTHCKLRTYDSIHQSYLSSHLTTITFSEPMPRTAADFLIE